MRQEHSRHQSSNHRHHRSRSKGGGRGQNLAQRSLDSNGPDVKIRGTASHICKKYQSLARDAQLAGNRIRAENYLQHADHYYRIILAAQAQQQSQQAAAPAPQEAQSGGADEPPFPEAADDMLPPEDNQDLADDIPSSN